MENETNFYNNPLVDRIRELERQVSSLNNTRQPQILDWVELPSSGFTYISALYIGLPDAAYSSTFQIGHRLRLKQGGDYKYYYVTEVQIDRLQIIGDLGASLTNTTISDFAWSNVSYPPGMPALFDFTPDVQDPFGNSLATSVWKQCGFRIDANVVTISAGMSFIPTAAWNNYTIKIPDLPVGSSFIGGGGQPAWGWYQETGAGQFGAALSLGAVDITVSYLTVIKSDRANWNNTDRIYLYPALQYSFAFV